MLINHKKVLITGADGFIGSHLTEALVRRGYSVRAMVFYNSFNTQGWLEDLPLDIRDNIEVFPADIRDPYRVREAVQGCELIFHLAALIAIPYSYQAPNSYIDTNIKGTLNVLQAARDFGICRIIHTSTSEVYGSARYVPIDEDHPLAAQSPYAASKIGADQLALSFYNSFATPVAVIRPFNTYGPRQSARAVIPTIIGQIASGQKHLKLGALHPTRDFNFIEDTVEGFLAVAQSKQAEGQVINIGSNYEISIEQMVYLIADIMEADIRIVTDAQRLRPDNSEVDRLWADNRKALDLLGWKPSYTGEAGLRRGLQKTIVWFREPENLKKYRTETYNI
ncbi:MAG: NAD-dependent 4,6-dehydratase LegB [Syntrophomonadaceae bacterium]|nr:NAD-dependent 4,6-dehydratase LegB [Syntrophomonadaceae bacterium]